jgi:hypothetical protein
MPTRDEVATQRAIQDIPRQLESIESRLALIEIALENLCLVIETGTALLTEAMKATKE